MSVEKVPVMFANIETARYDATCHTPINYFLD
jgi:hypothetical protein